MAGVTRFGISIESGLLKDFDKLIAKKGVASRSEAIRDLIRDDLVQSQWQDTGEEAVGTVTLVYSHHVHDLAEKLDHLQHEHHNEIVSTLHVHLDAHNCLEVLVVRGKSGDIKQIADMLIGTKGVKHGKLITTTTGEGLS